ncbi:AAA family ATPase, partial [Pacificimonas sp. WHA3]
MLFDLNFRTNQGQVSFSVGHGSKVLIAGPNGVGKSAFLATLYRSLPEGSATYLPGHRQINFNHGWSSGGQDAAQLVRNLFAQHDSFNRYKGAWAEDQFKSLIRGLLNLESKFNRDFRKNFALGHHTNTVDGSKRESPLDTVNAIFEAARLPVHFSVSEIGFSANREGSEYPIDAMSDGERAALFIVSAVVTQSPNSVLLIDEPEKHLHPSITGGLLDACIRYRSDISLIIASHDVSIIQRLDTTHVIHVKNSRVINTRPESRLFEADVLDNFEDVPENLRTDLLGSRSKTLFIEGEPTSYDVALYSHIYSDLRIIPKGGHGKVLEAVSALRNIRSEHRLNPFGLIDGDARSDQECEILKNRGIFTLPCPTIENIFFHEA